MRWLVLLAFFTGCATVSGIGPAVPLSPGTSEVQVGIGLQNGGNLLSRSTGYPLPAVAVGYRTGLKQGMDLGIRLMPLGVHTDLRLAVLSRERVHLAISPGISGSGLAGSSFGWGEVGIHLPLMGEVDVSDHWTMAIGAESTTFIRGGWLSGSQETAGAGVRVDEYVGLGLGAYWTRGRWRLGWQGSFSGSILRPAPAIWSTGPTLGVGPTPAKTVIK